jgi:hypothetical protein
MALVLDTGVLYANLDSSDKNYRPCRELLEESSEQLIIPAPVLVELDYWVRKFATADSWLSFCQDVASQVYAIFPVDGELLLKAAQLQAKYSDTSLGLVDAAVFMTCEILGESKVATLDRRHFAILRKADGSSLEILPGALRD